MNETTNSGIGEGIIMKNYRDIKTYIKEQRNALNKYHRTQKRKTGKKLELYFRIGFIIFLLLFSLLILYLSIFGDLMLGKILLVIGKIFIHVVLYILKLLLTIFGR
ncbi:hypothetical protein [Candidatus Parabeggiatoa sp. HSG14]|uniref:hypothetical protein n=1 Tax=Candidatus Parabeggiatoa sp. HSG14 TaxID=3055593 RepID=UPI0025A85E5C|nr:hypothetical protein [Thiotrichales bacterium HSG14]